MLGVNIRLSKYALRLPRRYIRILISLLTGHNTLNRHLTPLKRRDVLCHSGRTGNQSTFLWKMKRYNGSMNVRGTSSFRMSLEWEILSGRRPASDRRWQSSARYAGAAPASDWCTSPAILNATRWQTGSQCSCRSTGVMWSLRRAPCEQASGSPWADCLFYSKLTNFYLTSILIYFYY